MIFHIFGWGHRPRNSDLNSYEFIMVHLKNAYPESLWLTINLGVRGLVTVLSAAPAEATFLLLMIYLAPRAQRTQRMEKIRGLLKIDPLIKPQISLCALLCSE
ncbi:MAG: hypothetical protein K940chlam7_01184 [Chlamydiae bacterium]|nr:hypothetical protein [Chlamydiota bacterium]